MNRRGMILLGVLVVVAMAALAGTTAMYLAQAELASSRTALKRTQSRAAAWSGVQAVMAELADQREQLLDGQAPELPGPWDLYAEDGGPRCVVRLVLWGEDGPKAQSENAKLDLNTATVEMLTKAGLSESEAAAVVAARGAGSFASVGDLARVAGFEIHRLEEAKELTSVHEGPSSEESLRDLVTVFSFDPNIQCGLGNNGSEHRGKMRVNLHTPWSDRLAAAVDERFGDGASRGLKALFDRGAKFASRADIAAAAQQAGLPTASWGPIFDALTVSEDPHLIGLVDLNLATAKVLACVPGISTAAADQIVQARGSLDQDSQRSVCWPLVQGILETPDFVKAVDHLTTRSMQWRVRVEAGMAPPESEERLREQGPLSDRVVLEAVIDVSSERPRVAYLRDVTLEAAMATVYAVREAKEAERPARGPEVTPAAPQPAGHNLDADLKLDTDLKLDSGLDLSSGMDKGFGDLKLGPEEPSGPIQQGTGAQEVPAPASAEPGVDRRVGRWTTGERKAGG